MGSLVVGCGGGVPGVAEGKRTRVLMSRLL